MTTTGFVTDELCFWHDPGNYALMLKPGGFIEPYNRHIENADPKRRLLNLLDVSGLLGQMTAIAARDAEPAELTRLHSPDYVARVRQLAEGGGGDTGMGAPISSNGWSAARRSAGCALSAVDAVMQQRVDTAYALTRPPGHHAEPEQGMGFCIFANAALAAEHAIRQYGVQRVAIVDWDVHFGNGTQKCFEARRDVLTISVHQQAGFPLVKGEADELGTGDGLGYNLNVPLPPGCGFGAYRHAFEQIVLPALEAYRPELIIVACGYDAGRLDPLGRMMLDGHAFRWMTAAMQDMARRHAQGRLVMTHEGGYCPVSVPFFGLAVLEQLSGIATEATCPFTAHHALIPGQALQDHQRQLVAALTGHFEDVRQRHWSHPAP
ncbi:class II histone deacetylase [Variovorax terrae]|uniref:Class II histone deacetylase n=1 Tax=Variovorax terrae TaxID=2923278 RepID=A0A9X1VRH3_9BURK|nr:class II histone deacetylase [Variovorax terrae]MCJ0762481.1 class II histone deacetylase [Variovorax terrae]